MVRKYYAPEQIINKLREAEILLSQGNTQAVVWKKVGVSDCTYYRWRKEYGGMRIEQAKKLKNLEKENGRLKKLVADLSLDNAILKEATEGNFSARPGNARSSSRSRRNLVFHRGGHAQYSGRPGRPSGVYHVSRMKKQGWWHVLSDWRLSTADTGIGELQLC